MKTSEAIDLISAAIVDLQAEISNVTASSTNPFYHSKYADLATIISATRPLLSKHGLALIQGCNADILTTRLIHKSGQYYQSCLTLSVPKWDNPQDVGKAMTYARRYEQAAMLNIAQEDDDGNSLAKKSTKKVETITDTQAFDLQQGVEAVGDLDKFLAGFGVKNIADITVDQYPKAVQSVKNKQKAIEEAAK